MAVRDVVYRWYARRLRRGLPADGLPGHVALVVDGNRRWARQQGFDNPNVGHRYGAEHIGTVLGWCERLGIRHVTVYVASTANLRKRGDAEVAHLLSMVDEIISERLARPDNRWRLRLAGRLDELPDTTAQTLKSARDATAELDSPLSLTIAIGYDGHEEIVDAVRDLLDTEATAGTSLTDLAMRLTPEDIAGHLHSAGMPDPDLVIRTSGEHRLSGFLLWQTTKSQLYFCDVYWPGFRYIDFLRALRSYAARRRGETSPDPTQ